MNILTLSNYYPEHPGGVEFVAFNLVQHWREHHSVHWIACNDSKRPHLPAPGDIPLRSFNFTEERLGFPYPLPYPADLHYIIDEVRWCDFLHLHDCLYAANVFAFIVAQRYQKPVIITQHVEPIHYKQAYKNALQALAYHTIGRLLLHRAAHAIFISPRVKDWFRAHIPFKGQTHFIPNGLDRDLFYPAGPAEREQARSALGFSKGQDVALFVGRFTEKKGLHILRNLASARPTILWVLIGSGELNPHNWNLPNVRIVAPQPQASLRSFYIAADVFVLPSVGEGFPLSIQEAMACGLPVCTSQETTSLFPDAPLTTLDLSNLPIMLETLDTIIAKIKHSTEISSASEEYARRWDWKQVASAYELLFNTIVPSTT